MPGNLQGVGNAQDRNFVHLQDAVDPQDDGNASESYTVELQDVGDDPVKDVVDL